MSDSRKGPSERLAYLENKIEHLIRQGHIHEDAIRELKYKLSTDPRDRPEESKPIDWSQVADCVPVRVWDDDDLPSVVLFPAGTRLVNTVNDWNHASLITGIDIAWHGGECPLPDGVIVEFLTRGKRAYREHDAQEVEWRHHEGAVNEAFDVISFRVTGIHPDWTEEVG